MPFPTAVELTAGTKLFVQRSLPNRVLPTVNVTTSAAVIVGAKTIAVTAIVAASGLGSVAGDVLIQQGDKLTFNSTVPTTVTVSQDVIAGDLLINVLPVTTVIQSGNTATSNGFLMMLGVDDLSWKVSDKTIPTTSMESGIFTEEVKVRLGAEVSLSGFFRKGDPAAKQVLIPCANSLDLEVAFRIEYPDRKYRSGFALLKNWEEGGKLDQIITFKGTLMCQGAFEQGVLPV